MNTWFNGFYEGSAFDLSHRLRAAIALYKAGSRGDYLEQAANAARKLVALQTNPADSNEAPPCFWEGPSKKRLAESYFYFWHTSGPLGLCELLELLPNHADAAVWRRSILRLAGAYRSLSDRNPWGLVPGRWFFVGKDSQTGPGNEAADGDTLESNTVFDLPSGEDTHEWGAAGGGRSFLYAYHQFLYNVDDMSYSRVAGRQLDWVMGCNPLDSSTIEGVGYNQPQRGLFGEFFPPTPQIPGAVSCGIQSDSFDLRKSGLRNEYDMPAVGQVMWCMADLASDAKIERH
jgi:hypothetical protein